MDKQTKQQPEKNGLFTIVLTIGGFALFLVILAFVWVDRKPETVARGGRSPEERRALLEEQREREKEMLTEYGWVDRENGVVRLPIERAMELALKEINQEQN